ncbi:MAG: phosphatase PAP2 family protein [Clostridiaceae bacterium]|nr:phosphatase PAP2 family protein [Clostridiaceae bacterium]
MKKQDYEKIFRKISASPGRVRALQVCTRLISAGTAACYLGAVLLLFWRGQWRNLLVVLLVPGLTFLGVSAFRLLCNASRPYEVYGFQPLIPKDTKGKSFPSRHVFSVFVIGTTLSFIWRPGALVILAAGVLLAGLRVMAGVHFPKDVVAGAVIGVFSGLAAGFFII